MYGLGQTYRMDSSGTVVDCDLWSNFFNSICWTPGSTVPASAVPANVQPPAPLPPPAPVATPGNPNPLTTPPASGADATATINATLAQGMQNNQQNLLGFIQGLQNQALGAQCAATLLPSTGICDTWVYIGGGVAAFVVLMVVISKSGRRR